MGLVYTGIRLCQNSANVPFMICLFCFNFDIKQKTAKTYWSLANDRHAVVFRDKSNIVCNLL